MAPKFECRTDGGRLSPADANPALLVRDASPTTTHIHTNTPAMSHGVPRRATPPLLVASAGGRQHPAVLCSSGEIRTNLKLDGARAPVRGRAVGSTEPPRVAVCTIGKQKPDGARARPGGAPRTKRLGRWGGRPAGSSRRTSHRAKRELDRVRALVNQTGDSTWRGRAPFSGAGSSG